MKELENNFTYHKPFDITQELYTSIRSQGKAFAELISESVPCSREASIALTKIEEAVMWANAAVARNIKEK